MTFFHRQFGRIIGGSYLVLDASELQQWLAQTALCYESDSNIDIMKILYRRFKDYLSVVELCFHI